MAASERAERLLRFHVVEHPGADGTATVYERLTAAISQSDGVMLVRTLWLSGDDDTLMAPTLTASGPDAAVLLDRMAEVPIDRHFANVDDISVRRSYRIEPRRKGADTTDPDWVARLLKATARLDDLRSEFDAGLRDLPVDVRLYPLAGKTLELPRDLVAVLGRQWQSLQDYPNHWRSMIKVAKAEPQRTEDTEQKIERTVRHLSATLSRPPAAFHNDHLGARWRATLQSGSAILLTLALVIATLMLNQVADQALIRTLAFGAPPLMVLILFFAFDRLPNFEMPRIPRPLRQPHWSSATVR